MGGITLFNNFDNLATSASILKGLEIIRPVPNQYFSGVIYASYNVIVVMAFFSSLGSTAKSKKDCLWGGVLGGVAIMAAALVMYLAMFSQIGVLYDKSIPALYLADEISSGVGLLFFIMLMLGIYSTAVPLLWAVTNRFTSNDSPKFKMATLIITIFALIGGFLPFDKLVGILYPYTGYMGVLILICATCKTNYR